MTGSSRPQARLLAVLGLAAAAIAVVWVISSSSGGEDSSTDESSKVTESGCNPKAEGALSNGYYIVKPDESLSLIAERTCLEEDDLSSLNQELDPQALAPGQCLNLEERGCERLEE
jgi:LysM repeat protein